LIVFVLIRLVNDLFRDDLLDYVFKGYDTDSTTSNTWGVTNEQQVRTAGLAEYESVRAQCSGWGVPAQVV